MTEKELLELKESIERKKEKVSELKGQITYLKKELRDMGFNSVNEAKKELERLEEKGVQLREKVQEKTDELEEEYGINS